MEIRDYFQQRYMMRKLKNSYGNDTKLQKGKYGSIYMPSDAPAVPNWEINGESTLNKFIKRFGMTAIDSQGNEIA